MNERFGSANPPPTEREMTRVNLDFHRTHHAYLVRQSWRCPRTVDRADLANKVAIRFDRSYRNNPDFRAFVSEKGMMAVRTNHPFWGQWLSWEISDQWLRHYGAMPRLTTYPQNLFLRLAASRPDGMLLPLVGGTLERQQRRILNAMRKAKKVFSVPTDPGIGEWEVDADVGPMTLRLTPKGFGGGDTDVRVLVARGYLEELPTRDPRLRWRTDENVMVTVRLTEMGRAYIDALTSGSLLLSTDDTEGGTGQEISDDGPTQEGGDHSGDKPSAEGREDARRFRDWAKGMTLGNVLEAAIAVCGMTDKKAKAYQMYRSDDPPPFTLEEVAAEIGVTKSTVHRWVVEEWDEKLKDPEILRALRRHIDRTRDN